MSAAILVAWLSLVIAHCWSVSALFAYRFSLLRGIVWILPLILLPLLGPLIFFFATRRLRELNRPSTKKAVAWFVGVTALFLSIITYIGVVQYQHFNRRAADATVMSDLRNARTLLREHIETTGQTPENLSAINFAPSKPQIHIKYRKVGQDDFELTGWHEKGEREMKTSNKTDNIERLPKKNAP